MVGVLMASALLSSVSAAVSTSRAPQSAHSTILESIAVAPLAGTTQSHSKESTRRDIKHGAGHYGHSLDKSKTPHDLLPFLAINSSATARQDFGSERSRTTAVADALRPSLAGLDTTVLAKLPGEDARESLKVIGSIGDVPLGAAGEFVQGATSTGLDPLLADSTTALRPATPIAVSRESISQAAHPVISAVSRTAPRVASVKTMWSFDGIFPVLPTKSGAEMTASSSSTSVHPTLRPIPTLPIAALPVSDGLVTMGTDFATGTPLSTSKSTDTITTGPGVATVWVTNNGALSPSFITSDIPTTPSSISWTSPLTFTTSTTSTTSTTIQSVTPIAPLAQSSSAATATANDTWVYPSPFERFAIAVANPLAVALVCACVFAATKFNTRRHRRGVGFYGPPPVEERLGANDRNVTGTGVKSLTSANNDGLGGPDEDVSFEDFLGVPSRKAKSQAQTRRQPQMNNAEGIEESEKFPKPDQEREQGHDEAHGHDEEGGEELDYHNMLKDM